MRRTVTVIVLASLLVVAMTGVALARGSSAGYLNPVKGQSPHAGYADTTTKCKQCHAVHGAGDGLKDDGKTLVVQGLRELNEEGHEVAVDTEVLLRSTKNNACVFCHFNASYTSEMPYGTDIANYQGDSVFNHSGAHHESPVYEGCNSCHTVHGAVALSLESPTEGVTLSDMIKKTPNSLRTAEATNLSTFCASCHDARKNAADWFVNGDGAAQNFQDEGGQPGSCTDTCHEQRNYTVAQGTLATLDVPTKSTDVPVGTPIYGQNLWESHTAGEAGSYSPRSSARIGAKFVFIADYTDGTSHVMKAKDDQHAFVGSETCKSCHQGGQAGIPMNSFPHYTAGKQFLADSIGSGQLQPGGSATARVTPDGVCLSCHEDATGTQGVGQTF